MTTLSSRRKGLVHPPEAPACFRVLKTAVPLTGPDDTYWIAKAVWREHREGYEGFLIYADPDHYLFLDQAEADTVSTVIADREEIADQQQGEPLEDLAGTYDNALHVAFFSTLPLRLFDLPLHMRLTLTAVLWGLCLIFYLLLFPATAQGLVLLFPLVFSAWLFQCVDI